MANNSLVQEKSMSAIKKATRHCMLIFLLYYTISFGMFSLFGRSNKNLHMSKLNLEL